LLAALLLGQTPPPAALAGLAVILAGMVLVVLGNRGVAAEPMLEVPVE
jgi:drug/metabolite transporter (DMT)-like permease